MAEQKLPFRQKFVAIMCEKLLDLLIAPVRSETSIRECVNSLELAVDGSPKFPERLWPSRFFKGRLAFGNRGPSPVVMSWALELHDYLDETSSSTLAGR